MEAHIPILAASPIGRGRTSSPSDEADDYDRGRRDGLRLALAVIAAEEAKWAALVGESPSWRTNATREVRRKALSVAQQRITTVLLRITPRNDRAIDDEVAAAIAAVGL